MEYYNFGTSKALLAVATAIDLELVYFLHDVYVLKSSSAILLAVIVIISKYPILKVFTNGLNKKQLKLAMISCVCSFVLSIISGIFFIINIWAIFVFMPSAIAALVLAPIAVFVKIWLFVQINILKALLIIDVAIPPLSTATTWISNTVTQEV